MRPQNRMSSKRPRDWPVLHPAMSRDNAELKPAARIDDIDRSVIDILPVDGKMTNRELAQRVGVSEPTVSSRLRKLVSSGVLLFYRRN
jgi:uncharacterized membrane protein